MRARSSSKMDNYDASEAMERKPTRQRGSEVVLKSQYGARLARPRMEEGLHVGRGNEMGMGLEIAR